MVTPNHAVPEQPYTNSLSKVNSVENHWNSVAIHNAPYHAILFHTGLDFLRQTAKRRIEYFLVTLNHADLD